MHLGNSHFAPVKLRNGSIYRETHLTPRTRAYRVALFKCALDHRF
jgi:hypothetical protein